jgi:hypothetical protein
VDYLLVSVDTQTADHLATARHDEML